VAFFGEEIYFAVQPDFDQAASPILKIPHAKDPKIAAAICSCRQRRWPDYSDAVKNHVKRLKSGTNSGAENYRNAATDLSTAAATITPTVVSPISRRPP
jgi:hypothetical protein